ncbi:MAG TPA: metal-dependent hydrolase, partial [Thermoanaerobaculia bacterium]
MDPLTHALAGASIAWAAGGRHHAGRRALLAGAAAGLLPDLDVLIRSAGDPLLAIEHHRGFTHSLVFVPLGGTLAALLTGARRLIVPAILAYLSHALLDAATTYGTQLFWPFSRYRTGLDIISIIDPLFTLLLLCATIAAYRSRPRLVHAALSLTIVWLLLGLIQRERASAAQTQIATTRGHPVTRAAVFPTFANTIVWRSLYLTNGTIHMDRIRVPWLASPSHTPGPSVPLATAPHPDFTRLAWFSDAWTARDPRDPTLIGDARYSLHNDRYAPVWGIRLHPTRWV